jgi:hypothetical protein
MTILFSQETPTIDIFVFEALPVGVNKALEQFAQLLQQSVCPDANDKTLPSIQRTCICFGNTNLTLSHFREVLALAESYKRPVRFVRWCVRCFLACCRC